METQSKNTYLPCDIAIYHCFFFSEEVAIQNNTTKSQRELVGQVGFVESMLGHITISTLLSSRVLSACTGSATPLHGKSWCCWSLSPNFSSLKSFRSRMRDSTALASLVPSIKITRVSATSPKLKSYDNARGTGAPRMQPVVISRELLQWIKKKTNAYSAS